MLSGTIWGSGRNGIVSTANTYSCSSVVQCIAIITYSIMGFFSTGVEVGVGVGNGNLSVISTPLRVLGIINLIYWYANLLFFLIPVGVVRYLRAHYFCVEAVEVTVRKGGESSVGLLPWECVRGRFGTWYNLRTLTTKVHWKFINSNSCELLCFICVLSLSVNLLSFLSVFASHEFISADLSLRYRMFSSYVDTRIIRQIAASHDDAPMIGTQFGPPLPSFHSLQSSGGMIFNGVTVGAPSSSPICTYSFQEYFHISSHRLGVCRTYNRR